MHDRLRRRVDGGFARGAGHGATFQGAKGNYWHVSTVTIAVKNNFERRIGIWPAGFDKDDVMYCNTSFGDYPHYLPGGEFTDWMLLNYNKPVQVSSTLGEYAASNAVDESIKTYWSAATGDPGWAVYDPEQRLTRIFDLPPSVVPYPEDK